MSVFGNLYSPWDFSGHKRAFDRFLFGLFLWKRQSAIKNEPKLRDNRPPSFLDTWRSSSYIFGGRTLVFLPWLSVSWKKRSREFYRTPNVIWIEIGHSFGDDWNHNSELRMILSSFTFPVFDYLLSVLLTCITRPLQKSSDFAHSRGKQVRSSRNELFFYNVFTET